MSDVDIGVDQKYYRLEVQNFITVMTPKAIIMFSFIALYLNSINYADFVWKLKTTDLKISTIIKDMNSKPIHFLWAIERLDGWLLGF